MTSNGLETVGSDAEMIWGEGYRIFISHNSEDEHEAGSLKFQLEPYGVSVFVAHDDIRWGEKWQSELETALASSDALIALLTPRFRKSPWTDQEVGFAYSHSVRLMSVATESGLVPNGFLSQNQGFPSGRPDIASDIMKFLVGKEPRLLDDYINRLAKSGNWATSGHLGQFLKHIPSLNTDQTDRLVEAVIENDQIYYSFAFAKCLYDLNRLTGNKFEQTENGIRLKEQSTSEA